LEFLYEYGLFLAKAITILATFLIVAAYVAALNMRQRSPAEGHLEVTSLNERFDDLLDAMQARLLSGKALKKWRKQQQKARDQQRKQAGDNRRDRIFVIDFDGDLEASGAASLTQEVSAILSVAEAGDEVVVCLESQGGMVHGYGLAASQLHRIRSAGLKLTVAIDKVAASGGYMMACVGERILAAPFAIVGSIGVVAQLPNLNRLLKKNDVDYEMFTAGEFKRTVTVFGENTEAGRQKFQEEIEDVHALFKDFVAEHRPALDLTRVATGEAWHGTRALDLGLVDELSTSEDYLFRRRDEADLYALRWQPQQSPLERIIGNQTLTRAVARVLARLQPRGGLAAPESLRTAPTATVPPSPRTADLGQP
jgi:serine protease SohB